MLPEQMHRAGIWLANWLWLPLEWENPKQPTEIYMIF